ncbi:hypothetical protein HPP92_006179 [Vanilla planifolia]|uniref:Uncharacterized protein n=1 Tax=Vanilla planifolia TaxID=51239 RepID=A0A835RMS3_VANPL|nr:hypothetical protein HPP92_006471 [Vanilla planifolia]KAG0495185.1 hypothetical protein HPP92_006179 [Vanilla planifolia]
MEEAKEEISWHGKGKHSKETHGTSDDIDENTPIDKVKGPSVFQRAKEEIEASWKLFIQRKNMITSMKNR